MNSRHVIRSPRPRAPRARASLPGWSAHGGQQRPRGCETAPGLGSILPRRTASQKGISCSMRGSRSPWRGQDDRPRRSSRTPFSPPKHCLWPPDAARLLGGDHLARPTRSATKSSHASGDQKNPETARKTPLGIARPATADHGCFRHLANVGTLPNVRFAAPEAVIP